MKLYHIGKRPAYPSPRRHCDSSCHNGVNYNVAVFLTPDPIEVAYNHGIRGNVYCYDVPKSTIKACGGINRFDCAKEVIISATLWHTVSFVGKTMDRKTLDSKTKRYEKQVRAHEKVKQINSDIKSKRFAVTFPNRNARPSLKEIKRTIKKMEAKATVKIIPANERIGILKKIIREYKMEEYQIKQRIEAIKANLEGMVY